MLAVQENPAYNLAKQVVGGSVRAGQQIGSNAGFETAEMCPTLAVMTNQRVADLLQRHLVLLSRLYDMHARAVGTMNIPPQPAVDHEKPRPAPPGIVGMISENIDGLQILSQRMSDAISDLEKIV